MSNQYFATVTLWLLLLSVGHAAQHCVVLQYHHVSDTTPGITSVTPGQFQQHLDYLHENAFHVMALEDAVSAISEGGSVPDRCVALTIDDAYLSAYTEAYPRARRYGFPLTVFVATEPVDRGFQHFMTWDQMREMAANGVTFQNHTHTHAHLIRMRDGETSDDWEQRIASEILLAQNRIHGELGATPTLFAYPYGEYNTTLKRVVRSMGLVGFGQQSGPIWAEGDLAALPRFPMASIYAGMKTFPHKVSSLPLPITDAFPREPVVDLDEWQPSLTLTFRADVPGKQRLSCYVNGSPAVNYEWFADEPNTVRVTSKRRLHVGRNRYNCTLPSTQKGRFHWYSHNWIRRKADGSWYDEAY